MSRLCPIKRLLCQLGDDRQGAWPNDQVRRCGLVQPLQRVQQARVELERFFIFDEIAVDASAPRVVARLRDERNAVDANYFQIGGDDGPNRPAGQPRRGAPPPPASTRQAAGLVPDVVRLILVWFADRTK